MSVFEKIKDKVLLFADWIKAAIFKITASDKTVCDVEHDRVLNERLQDELFRCKEEIDYQKNTIEEYQVQLNKVRQSLREIAKELIKAGVPYENIYTLVASGLDSGGWSRLDIAKKLIPENIYTFFYAEDNIGKFEFMEGDELLYWLELTKFGDLKHEFHGSYEMVASHRIKAEEKSYADYRKRLHRLVLEELIKATSGLNTADRKQAS